ncbi:conserved hypothetical protein [Aeromicrobium sp. 9AM]|nr:conserved hypothetical protein [Aeromicrobium sp. 9AM]
MPLRRRGHRPPAGRPGCVRHRDRRRVEGDRGLAPRAPERARGRDQPCRRRARGPSPRPPQLLAHTPRHHLGRLGVLSTARGRVRPGGAEGAIPPRNLSGTKDHATEAILKRSAFAVGSDRRGGVDRRLYLREPPRAFILHQSPHRPDPVRPGRHGPPGRLRLAR